MRRILETVFSHRLRLLALIILPIVASLAVELRVPRLYEASGSLWALKSYAVIGATGPESSLTATPAETQASVIFELLQTRAFDLTVAHATDLPATLSGASAVTPQALDDALAKEIATKVVVTSKSGNLIVLTYVNVNPVVAREVVKAVIDNYGKQSASLASLEGQRLLQGYQDQLAVAQKNAQAAVDAEQAYLASHPGIDPAHDPQYAVLRSKAEGANGTLASVQESITNVSTQLHTLGNGEGSLYQVLDNPVVPSRPLSRTKELVLSAGLGLVLGLLASVIYMVLLLSERHGAYTTRDLRHITGLPVVGQVPHLTSTGAGASVSLAQPLKFRKRR